MRETKIDLFELHDENDRGQGRIKAVLNEKLQTMIITLFRDIETIGKFKTKETAKMLGYRYDVLHHSIYDYKKLSVRTIKDLVILWSKILKKSDNEMLTILRIFNSCIDLLTYGAGNTYKIVKAPKILTEDLCKIAGAIIADGHLTKVIKESGSPSYMITVDDQYENNLENFCRWINKEFGVVSRYRFVKNHNYWRTDFGNKIIYRYLNHIFKIPKGEKYQLVKTPKIIKNATKNLKLAFLNGLFMFDGGVSLKSRYFNYSTKSCTLLKEVENMLRQFKIKPDYVSKEISPITRVAEIRIWKRKELTKLFNLFKQEKNVEKWLKLNALVNLKFEKLKEVRNLAKGEHSEKIQELMEHPNNIRNIGIVSHIHHGSQ